MITSFALVVFLVIDQFRTDELLRQAHLDPAGLGRLVNEGIFYDDAHHSNYFNMTCPGHAEISTGAFSGLNGIMLNEEWDYKKRKHVYCVEDADHHWIDAKVDPHDLFVGTSAKRLLTTTVGDEVKFLWPDSKVISVAMKDRSAILMGGHAADGAYWYAPLSQKWTSSDAFLPSKKLPAWLEKFNGDFQKKPLPPRYDFSVRSVDDVTNLAATAFDGEKLGSHKHPDILWLSYSTHDMVGHFMGDDTDELREILKAEDHAIGRLINHIQKAMGGRRFLVVMTGDHGAGINSRLAEKINIPSGVLNEPKALDELNKCMGKKPELGEKPVAALIESNAYLSDAARTQSGVRELLKECLISLDPGFLTAYSRNDILENHVAQTPWLKSLAPSYNPERGADAIGVLKPYWNSRDNVKVNHETPYDYDNWVPLAVWWPGVHSKKVHRRVAVTSVAPTAARILNTRRPSGATSEYLTEVLDALH